MIELVIAGASVYMTVNFKNFWSDYYSSVAKMQKSVAILKASPQIHLPTLEYGQYQPVLVPLARWPQNGGKYWAREIGTARLHLTAQPNSDPLSKDEPNFRPLTKCALLDAAIRKCFNSDPPIPMDVYVRQQRDDSADKSVHTMELEWTHGDGDDRRPTRLRFTMTCPFKPDSPRAHDGAKEATVGFVPAE